MANDKADVLNQMVELMSKSGKINDVETYRKGVFAREEEGTTGIGEGIAIPHCKSKAVSKPGLAAMVVPDGVEYEALDGAPVNLLFLIAAPDTKENVHLDVLSKLSVLLMNKDFTNGLKNAKSVEEFMTVIDRFENEKDEETVEKNNGYDVVAVTNLCKRHHVALYDAIEECDIVGSSDSSIRNVVPANIQEFLQKAPIRRIILNGKKSESCFYRYQNVPSNIEIITLPSTSPANAAWSMERLLEVWKKALS